MSVKIDENSIFGRVVQTAICDNIYFVNSHVGHICYWKLNLASKKIKHNDVRIDPSLIMFPLMGVYLRKYANFANIN